MEYKYIILGDNKTPIEKLEGGGRSFVEVEDFSNVGVLIPKPYVVLDVDTDIEGKIVFDIIKAEGIKCGVMKTPHGYHFWFRTEVEMKNSVKSRLAIGIRGDFRSWGTKGDREKLSYVRIKREGEWCEWLQEPENCDPFPFFLRPVRANDEIFKEMGEGDGRNQALFNYILTLQSKHFTKDEIRTIVTLINSHVFTDPLPEGEIATILRDESFKEDIDGAGEFGRNFLTEKGEFKHDVFANALVAGMRILTVNDVSYVYQGGVYVTVEREIERRMIEEYPIIKRNQRQEVLDYIRIITNRRADTIPKQEYVINLLNTRLDVRTSETLPFDPEVIDFAQLPVMFDPSARCDHLDKMLIKVFKGDTEVIDLFEEMVGYMLVKANRYRKGFLFYGSGSNGKSTIIDMLKRFLGESNYSDLPMHKLSDTFLTAELENKLANLGDDIDPTLIKETGTMKKLFTGESIPVQRKYGQPFKLHSYAKLIFSCNELPYIADKSAGMYSRLLLIPFTAVFSPTDPDFDPYILDKITTPQGLSHLLNRALKGLHRLFHNNAFTYPAVVRATNERYQVDNSQVLSWMDEEGIDDSDLLLEPTDRLYGKFNDWCSRTGIRNVTGYKSFHKELSQVFHLDKVRRRSDGALKWFFTSVE